MNVKILFLEDKNMKREEFDLLGITVSQYEELFNEKLVFDGEVSNIPVIKAAPVVPVVPVTPVATVTETVISSDSMSFKNIKAAAEYIASNCGLKVSNALDGLYKIKRRGANKTHGYTVQFCNDKSVVLTQAA